MVQVKRIPNHFLALGNGKVGAKAGFACIFPDNESWNIYQPLEGRIQTNNRAEYSAAIAAFTRANAEDPQQTKSLHIYSDSALLIRSMTEWCQKWQLNNWKKANGDTVLNDDLLKKLISLKGQRKIVWKHVKAHTGGSDWESVWNDKADHFAKMGAAGSNNQASLSSDRE
jgi:ribonuclease HI